MILLASRRLENFFADNFGLLHFYHIKSCMVIDSCIKLPINLYTLKLNKFISKNPKDIAKKGVVKVKV